VHTACITSILREYQAQAQDSICACIKDEGFGLPCMRQCHACKIAFASPVLCSCLLDRANADEMAASLQELGTMQTTAADLRARIQDVDSGLNRVGKAYLHHLTDWQEHSSIMSNLTHSVQVSTYD